MSKLNTAIRLIQENKKEFCASLLENLNFFFPDKLYLELLFFIKTGKRLNLKKPKTFNEKIQWLKLYNRKNLYTTLVDKYTAKDFVAKKIGEEHIIPLYGVWKDANDITYQSLPNQFVLKTTNGGGGDVVICKNKNEFNKTKIVKHLNHGLKKSIYKKFREWPYKNVSPRVIAEKYLEDEHGELYDYKFYCFDGVPQFCQVIRNRFHKETIDFYDLKWTHMPFVGLNLAAENGVKPVEKPLCLDDMVESCKKLSKGIPFVRVDFYVIKSNYFFGEMTFYPASGFGTFRPDGWNEKIGELLNLPIEEVR